MNAKFQQLKHEIDSYLNDNKNWQESLLNYLDSPEIEDENFSVILAEIDNKQIASDCFLFEEFLYFLAHISTHHKRSPGFLDRLIKILHQFQEQLSKYTNEQLFHFFKYCPPIIFSLQNLHMIEFDEEVNCIISSDQFLTSCYRPTCESIENFRQIQQIGENHTYLCQLIREDDVSAFSNEIDTRSLSLASTIDQSIFETNSFLKSQNRITIIQYAAASGSEMIFQFLLDFPETPVVLDEDIWPFAIYGQNASILDKMVENEIPFPPEIYKECILQSISCHHHQIFDWMKMKFDINFESNNDEEIEIPNFFINPLFKAAIQSHNFTQMQDHFNQLQINDLYCEETLTELFYDICSADFYFIPQILLNIPEIDVNDASPFDPFQKACKEGNYNVVNLILLAQSEAEKNQRKKRFNLNNQSYSTPSKNEGIPDGLPGLALAIHNNQFTIVKKLLTIEEIRCNQCSRWKGNTPLGIASRNGQLLMVKLLLENSKDIDVNLRNFVEYKIEQMEMKLVGGGLTPLLLAIQNNHKDVVKLLLDHNADKSIKNALNKDAADLAKSLDVDVEIKQLFE